MTDDSRVPSLDVSRDEMEAHLVRLQTDVSRGNLAVVERNAVLVEMNRDGWTQQQLADLLNVAAQDVGDEPITQGAVHKAIRRLRRGEVKAAR